MQTAAVLKTCLVCQWITGILSIKFNWNFKSGSQGRCQWQYRLGPETGQWPQWPANIGSARAVQAPAGA